MPPKLWERLLAWATPARHREAALGDAAEELDRRRRRDGARAARRWYRRQALRSLGPGARHRLGRLVAAGDTRPGGDGTMERWLQDLRLAARALMKRPLFSAVVVLTLALGVGANTALFGVFRAVFLEPVDLPEPDELVVVMEAGSFGCCGPASGPDYLDWRERSRSFEELAALSPRTFNLTGLEEPRRVLGTLVTASAFPLAGVQPLLGRWILPDDQVPDEPQVAVLSHGFWQRALGGDPEVVGTSLELDGSPLTVVGVMPAGFDVPSPWARTTRYELYLPFPSSPLAEAGRGNHSFPVVGRLSEGVSLDAAQADMDRVLREIAAEHPGSHAERTARVFTVHDYLYGDVGGQLLLILGAAGLVLLIACGNVAGLQLARAVGRESELAVRAAVGASRRALVRLLFSESLVLAVLGGAAGIGLSFLAVDGVRALLPPSIPRADQVGIDGTALLFALGATGLTALLFGMLPALLASRSDLAGAVKEGGHQTLAPAKERLRDGFIVVQIALGLVLVNGAALLVQSYAELAGEEMGFQPDGVLTFALAAGGPRYDTRVERLGFYEEVVARVGAVPGVQTSGMVSKLPLNGGTNGQVWVEGRPRPASGEGVLVEVSSVVGDYFAAMGIDLLAGRSLLPQDTATASVGVVVNQAFVDQAWPDEDPLGKRFTHMTSDPEPEWVTVVGVVENVRQWRPEEPPLPEAYYPFVRGWSNAGYVVTRVAGDPAAAAPAVRRAVLGVDPTQPPSELRTMTDRVDAELAQRRFYTTLIGLFAVAALLLAAAGIYGTVSYFVARRTRELGIRLALGAGGGGVVGLVLRRGVRLAVWGVGVGLAGVWASTTLLESLVYGVGAMDGLTLAAGCVVLAGAAVLASTLPALRAVRVSPVTALRAE